MMGSRFCTQDSEKGFSIKVVIPFVSTKIDGLGLLAARSCRKHRNADVTATLPLVGV
jgi:hypothetical protein